MFVFMICFMMKKAYAQTDPHFTQYNAFTAFLNPATTGIISNGDSRLIAIHRNQWNKVTDPYSTIGISYDMLNEHQWGIGVVGIHQSAGNGGFKSSSAYFNICNNNIAFGDEESHHIGIALQAGINYKRIDPQQLQFGDQYNPASGYDPSIISSANRFINRKSLTQLDAGAGLYYFYTGNEQSTFFPYAGFSMLHINQPKDNFSDRESIVPIRYVFHTGAVIYTQSRLSVCPGLIFMKQGQSAEIVPGVQGEYYLNPIASMSLGANLRIGDAINALASITYRNTRLGFSYDINVSKLNNFVKPVNSIEFSITRIGIKPNGYERMIQKCPKVKL